jgi:hypothetical protein
MNCLQGRKKIKKNGEYFDGELLPWGFATSGLASSLLGTSHLQFYTNQENNRNELRNQNTNGSNPKKLPYLVKQETKGRRRRKDRERITR